MSSKWVVSLAFAFGSISCENNATNCVHCKWTGRCHVTDHNAIGASWLVLCVRSAAFYLHVSRGVWNLDSDVGFSYLENDALRRGWLAATTKQPYMPTVARLLLSCLSFCHANQSARALLTCTLRCAFFPSVPGCAQVALSLVEMHTQALQGAKEGGDVIELLQCLGPRTFDSHHLIATAYGTFRDVTSEHLQVSLRTDVFFCNRICFETGGRARILRRRTMPPAPPLPTHVLA